MSRHEGTAFLEKKNCKQNSLFFPRKKKNTIKSRNGIFAHHKLSLKCPIKECFVSKESTVHI